MGRENTRDNNERLAVSGFVRATWRGVELGFRGPGQPLPDGALAATTRDDLANALSEVTHHPQWVERNRFVLQALARPALLSADLPFEPGCSAQSYHVDGIEVTVYRYSPFLG